MSILGNRVLRLEDPKFLTTGGVYAADLDDPRLEGAAWVTFVRSTMAHARIASIDCDGARLAPGVVGVYTARELGLEPLPPPLPFFPAAAGRPLLAIDTVRFVGEPVVAVLTERPSQGEDAAEQVLIDYEPLEAVVDPEAALEADALLFPEVGSNVVLEGNFGSDPSLFDGCDVVVSERIVNQRLAASPLEVRGAAAAWIDGRLTVWVSTQNAQAVRDMLEGLYPQSAPGVHVITPDVGGGFGAKIGTHPEELLLGMLADRAGRPVRWTETRTENMTAMGQGRDQVQYVTIGGTRDGRVLAYRFEILQDAGAYPMVGGALCMLFTRTMAAGVYDIPRIECNTRTVVTNKVPVVPYRGAGRPEATAAIERAIDRFAAELGIDPAEVRRRNLIPEDAFPHTTAVGATYDIGDYERALDLVLDAAGYAELRAEQARRRASGDAVQLGIGLSAYVEITNGAPPNDETARIEVQPDGSAVVHTGTSPHGQGHATSWAMLASDRTGIPIDRITVLHGDTDLVPKGGGTYGSRSLQMGGSAVHQAAGELVDAARDLAARLLEADPADVVLDTVDGVFHVAGAPAVRKTWAELAVAARDDGGSLAIDTVYQSGGPTFPFGAHVAVVEVDTETGGVRLVRHVACDDAGRVINPMLLEGQIHGGIAQGAAQALLEEVRYDDDGNPITSNFADYAVISSAELPSFEVVHMETPTPVNPLGVKGVGESGTIGSTPAVQNAVVDALAHLGVRHVDMPATAERVWRAIQAAQAE